MTNSTLILVLLVAAGILVILVGGQLLQKQGGPAPSPEKTSPSEVPTGKLSPRQIITTPEGKFMEYQGFRVPVIQARDLREGYILPIRWKASKVMENNCSGPVDEQGLSWDKVDFDDTKWESLQLPDTFNVTYTPTYTDYGDRFYRGYFYLDLSDKDLQAWDFQIELRHEDGIWIYVNGQLLNPTLYGEEGFVDCHADIDRVTAKGVISSYLQPGLNVIAAHVSEYDGAYFDAFLSVVKKGEGEQ